MRDQVAQAGGSVQQQAAVAGGQWETARGVKLVFELADDLLQYIFCRDEAERGAELIYDDGNLAAALLELLQQLDGELCLGHQEDVVHHLTQHDAGRSAAARLGDGAEVDEARDVLAVDHADDVVAATRGVEDRDARVLLLDDTRAGGLQRQVSGEREDLTSRRHDLAGCDLAKLERAVDHLFLNGRQQAHATGRGGHQLQFVRRVRGGLGAQRRVKETQHQRRGDVH